MLKLWSIFAVVFLAELGDKTQLATLLFATDRANHPLAVFAAAAGALVLSTAIAVALGQAAGHYLAAVPLKPIAGAGFVVLGVWLMAEYFRGA